MALLPPIEATVTLDPELFKRFIVTRKQWYNDQGSYPSVIVLPGEIEEQLIHAMFRGKFNDFLSYSTDRHGKVRMYLAGVKAMFSDKVPLGSSLWVLDKDVVPMPDGVVTPPTGPGAPNNGGTPIAMRMAA